ncbi:MAG: helix-turn-helix domain-containing protein [Candidatus Portnoybacteria bacterium]|jgi:hypothetical protein|nr:helix-turn-helix domain-containing protein [Candidatus Portnoybacteria bacterium]MDD5438000.1 helix-turn-helix domain-containing protein [Patescibacteria group bacterium]
MKNKKIRGWYKCPRRIDLDPSLSLEAKLVFHNFAAHKNNRTGDCFPSIRTQAKEIGFGVGRVKRGRAELIKMKWITKEHLRSADGRFGRWNWEIHDCPDDIDTTRTEGVQQADETINKNRVKKEEKITKPPSPYEGEEFGGISLSKHSSTPNQSIAEELLFKFFELSPALGRECCGRSPRSEKKYNRELKAAEELLELEMEGGDIERLIKIIEKSPDYDYFPIAASPTLVLKNYVKIYDWIQKNEFVLTYNNLLCQN